MSMSKNKKSISSSSIKSPLTFNEQLELLKNRNIVVTNENQALEFLKNNNYYRFTVYALQFREKGEKYKERTKFSTIVNIYNFDKALRRILFSLLEDFEISFKTNLSYHLSHKYGPECYLDKNIFLKNEWYLQFKSALDKNIKKSSNELFIRHHLNRYEGRFPFWVIVEIIPFGAFSKFFNNLNTAEKNDFSRQYYNYSGKTLSNWVHHFSVVRNICAHYGRLYNKNIFPKLKFLKEDDKNLKSEKVFDTFFILKKFFYSKLIWDEAENNMEKMLEKYKDSVNIKLIGFPNNWKKILQ